MIPEALLHATSAKKNVIQVDHIMSKIIEHSLSNLSGNIFEAYKVFCDFHEQHIASGLEPVELADISKVKWTKSMLHYSER